MGWCPRCAARDKAARCIKNIGVSFGAAEHCRECNIDKRPLMAIEFTRNQASIVIKAEDGKGRVNDMGWLAIAKCDHDVGHAYPRSRKAAQGLAGGVIKHAHERSVGQAIERVLRI